jgi:hypothetical protein
MILPDKHLSLQDSLLGTGAEILQMLDLPQSVPRLWENAKKSGEIGSFEKFSLGLTFLFVIEAIEIHSGLIRRTSI